MGLLPKFIDDAAGPPAHAVGNTLSNIWELGIGSHVSLWLKKQEYRQNQNYEDYIQKVEENTQNIPEEFLSEPQLNIVGPAIEASKYYIESEELRAMFANLIASSIDSRKINETHPSFVEIIKQLSPLDAQILKNFHTTTRHPIAQVRIVNEENHFITTQDHIMDFTEYDHYELKTTSLSNLQRLGLLDINYSNSIPDSSKYDFVKNHPAYEAARQQLIVIQEVNPSFNTVSHQEGICERTPLCKDFVKVCL